MATMTRVDNKKQWTGFTGRIDEKMIREHCSNWKESIYYIAGPPGMVDGMQEMLQGMGINDEHFHLERFTGYK